MAYSLHRYGWVFETRFDSLTDAIMRALDEVKLSFLNLPHETSYQVLLKFNPEFGPALEHIGLQFIHHNGILQARPRFEVWGPSRYLLDLDVTICTDNGKTFVCKTNLITLQS